MTRTLALTLCLLTAFACAPATTDEPAAEPAPEESPAADDAVATPGTLDEARALLERATAHYDQVGRDAALADFTAGGAFVDRDLYVFCYGPDRTISAHGADANLIGVDIDGLRDVDGKAFATEIWEVAQQPDGGTVEYQWANPVTGQVEPKISVVRAIGQDVCGVGAYRAE